MKKLLLIFTLLLTTQFAFSQKYMKPVNGGFKSLKTGKDFHLVELKGKDSLEIYNILLSMTKEFFSGTEDKILEKREGSYIKAFGYAPRGIDGYYDAKFEVEFKIKNERYIFNFSKFDIEANEKTGNRVSRVLIKCGSNFFTPDDYTTFLLHEKDENKPTMKHKDTYNGLIKLLDFYCGKYFDLTDNYKKYEGKIKDNNDW